MDDRTEADQPAVAIGHRPPQPRFVAHRPRLAVLGELANLIADRRIEILVDILPAGAGGRAKADRAAVLADHQAGQREVRRKWLVDKAASREALARLVGILTVGTVYPLGDAGQIHEPAGNELRCNRRPAAGDGDIVDVALAGGDIVDVAAFARMIA